MQREALQSKAGLVLTGGGARASYQVGVLRALAEILPANRNPFPIISGTSTGAINAGYFASRAQAWTQAVGGMYALWDNLDLSQIYSTDNFALFQIAAGWISRSIMGGRLGTKHRANFLLDTQPLRELLKREIDFSIIHENFKNQSLIGFSISATHYLSGTTVSFFHNSCHSKPWLRSNRKGVSTELNLEHIMASSAIPIFFPPIKIDSQYFGDGTLRQTSPLSPAIHMGADRILAISIWHQEKIVQSHIIERHPPSLAELGGALMRSIFADALDSDLERFRRINKGLSRIPPSSPRHRIGDLRSIPVLVLSPSRPLEEVIPPLLKHFPGTLWYLFKGLGVSNDEGNQMMSYLSFLNACIRPVMELGYHDTLAKKEKILQFMEEKHDEKLDEQFSRVVSDNTHGMRG